MAPIELRRRRERGGNLFLVLLGRRTAIGHSGIAFGSAFTQTLGYNDRNELTSSSRTDDAALDLGYTYDPIGNRTQHTQGTPAVSTTYVDNELNQYTRVYRSGSPQAALFPSYDADGNLSRLDVAGDLNP